MKLARVASSIFIGSLFAIVMIWGYLPRVWVMGWPQLALLALSGVGLVAWLIFSLDAIRLWLKKRSTQFAIGLGITAVMAIVMLGTVNWLAASYNVKKDLTANQLHSLSDQTKKIAAGLQEPIVIRVWSTNIDRMSTNLDMRRFLENYKIAGKGKITLEIKNPNEDVPNAKADNVKKDNLIVVRSESGREARIESFTDTKGEEQITNALVQAIKGRKKTVCFVSGHGELALDGTDAQGLSTMKTSLVAAAYEARDVPLATAETIPTECEALVLAGPRSEGTEREAGLLKDYLEKGGKMIALLGPGTPAGWRKFVAAYGVNVRDDLIVDPRVRPPIYVATKNFARDVEITKSFGSIVILPESSSIQVSAKDLDGETVDTFISSESYTFAKTGDLKKLKSLAKGSGDLSGPLPVAVLVRKTIAPVATPAAPAKPVKPAAKPHASKRFSLISEAYAQDADDGDLEIKVQDAEGLQGLAANAGNIRSAPPVKDGPKDVKNEMALVVVSNHNFIMNSFVSQVGNLDLFLNSVNFLLKDQDLMGIRPREIRQAALELNAENLRQVYATVLLIAGAFLMGGIMARRRKSMD